jgi:hypothetical protein
MNSENARKDALHGPWPSTIEQLEAVYGDRWEIYRELDTDGHHGPWVARPIGSETGGSEELRANDSDSLAELLAKAES